MSLDSMAVLLLPRDAAEACGTASSKIVTSLAIIPQQAEHISHCPRVARPRMEPSKSNNLGQRAERSGSRSHGKPLATQLG